MSTTNKDVNTSTDSTNVDNVTDPIQTNVDSLSKEDLARELARVKLTNDRLLEESKKHKLKAKQTADELLLAEGKKDELITSLKNQIGTFQTREKASTIERALEEEGRSRGCVDWTIPYKVLDGVGIEYDDESGEVTGVKEFFDKAQNHTHLSVHFKKRDQVTTENRTPNADKAVDYKKDPKAYLMKIRKDFPSDQKKWDEAVQKLKAEGLI